MSKRLLHLEKYEYICDVCKKKTTTDSFIGVSFPYGYAVDGEYCFCSMVCLQEFLVQHSR